MVKDKRWYGEKTITVADLMKQLSVLPADLPVATEGCDCLGDVSAATRVTDLDGKDYVLIERPSRYKDEDDE